MGNRGPLGGYFCFWYHSFNSQPFWAIFEKFDFLTPEPTQFDPAKPPADRQKVRNGATAISLATRGVVGRIWCPLLGFGGGFDRFLTVWGHGCLIFDHFWGAWNHRRASEGPKWPKKAHISGQAGSWPPGLILGNRGSLGGYFCSLHHSFNSQTFLAIFEKIHFLTPKSAFLRQK